MNLIKLTGALAFALLVASAPLVPQSDRDMSRNRDFSRDPGLIDNSLGDRFGHQADRAPGVPYGEQSSHYPPYYQSTQ
jgi:hypothetical protein